MKDEKKKEKIIGFDMDCKVGKPAKIQKTDGLWYKTSPVIWYTVAGGNVVLETLNTVYTTKDEE